MSVETRPTVISVEISKNAFGWKNSTQGGNMYRFDQVLTSCPGVPATCLSRKTRPVAVNSKK